MVGIHLVADQERFNPLPSLAIKPARPLDERAGWTEVSPETSLGYDRYSPGSEKGLFDSSVDIL